MAVIFYKKKRKIVRYTKADKKLVITLGKRFFNGTFIDWKSAKQTPEFKKCWFAKVIADQPKGLSRLYYHFAKRKPYPTSIIKTRKERDKAYRNLKKKIYNDIPMDKKPDPKSVFTKKDWKIINSLADKYRLTCFINWKLLSQDKLFKKLPIQDIIYLRKWYNVRIRNNRKDVLKYRRKKALEYKTLNKDRYRELTRKRARTKVLVVNTYLRDLAMKHGRYIKDKE